MRRRRDFVLRTWTWALGLLALCTFGPMVGLVLVPTVITGDPPPGYQVLIFVGAVLVGVRFVREPATRLSTTGLRLRLGPEQIEVPWARIERLWLHRDLNGAALLLVRLHDTGGLPGPGTLAGREITKNRAWYDADLAVGLGGVLPGARRNLGTAIAWYSNGTRSLHADPTQPMTGGPALRNRMLLLGCAHLGFLSLQVVALIMVGQATDDVRGVMPLWPVSMLSIPLFGYLAVYSFAGALMPHQLSTAGIRLRAVRVFRYDATVPWGQVERIWLGQTGLAQAIMIRVRDPEVLAGTDRRLRRRMRINRGRTTADFFLLPFQLGTSLSEFGAVVDRHSGGTVAFGRDAQGPAEYGQELVLRNRWSAALALGAALFSYLALMISLVSAVQFSAVSPWLILLGVLPLAGLYPLVTRLSVPPRLSAAGLRLRTAAWARYDTEVPWSRVAHIRLVGGRLLVDLHDDGTKLKPLRAGAGRRADLVVPLTGVTATREQIAAAVAQLSGGTVKLGLPS